MEHASSAGASGSKDARRDDVLHSKFDGLEFPFCRDAFQIYEKLAKIGQGTFGEVFKARDKKSKRLVALKKVLMENEKEGFPITALREIKILQLLKHENVVRLLEICRTKATQYNRYKSTFYLVFEFCEHDLAGLLSNPNVKFSLGEIKKVMQQLLNGLYYIHSNKILHRDMKAANILITKNGVLKLADFGLARAFSLSKGQPNRYTNRVVTLWYRPPELLLGERNYGPPIDTWGAGCIMAEMWTRSPIMQGTTEQHQLTLISQLCGSITPEVFPAVEHLETYNKLEIPKGQKRKVKDRLKPYVKDQYALDLLDKLLSIDPKQRLDADNALNHDFFWTDPMPCDLGRMLSPRSPIMQGTTEQHQLTLISQLCGSITPEVFPAVEHLETYNKLEIPKGQKRKVKDRLKPYVKDQYALDLLDKLLSIDPKQRLDADNALNHDFFWTDPMPCDLGRMLSQHTTSMFEFLAPPRRGRGAGHPHMAQPRPTHVGDQHFERIF